MNVNITSITTISGSAGGTQRVADVVLRVTGSADTVEAVREYVEQACVKPVKTRRGVRVWDESKLTIEAARQDEIERGDLIRAYDFPGLRDDCYLEAIVTEVNGDVVQSHVVREVHEGVEEMVSRFTVGSPLGVSSMSGAPCVFLLQKRGVRS